MNVLTAQVPAEGAGGVAGLIETLAFILMIIMVYFMITVLKEEGQRE